MSIFLLIIILLTLALGRGFLVLLVGLVWAVVSFVVITVGIPLLGLAAIIAMLAALSAIAG